MESSSGADSSEFVKSTELVKSSERTKKQKHESVDSREGVESSEPEKATYVVKRAEEKTKARSAKHGAPTLETKSGSVSARHFRTGACTGT